MKKRVLVMAAVVLAAGGCALSPFPTLETRLAELKGKAASEVIAKLGDPSRNEQIGGEKAYVWSLSGSGSLSDAAVNTLAFQCTIKVFVDKDDKVAHYSFSGNVAGCGQYAHRLHNSYNLIHLN